jgi:hypothetical protein
VQSRERPRCSNARHDVSVPRRLIVWLVTLPLAIAGTQIAHALAYRLVTPAHHERAHELSATGHGYLAFLPLALAVGPVLVVFALAAEARHVRGSSPGSGARPRTWHFAVVAPGLFFCQEHLERLFHDGGFPWDAALAPSFLTGLVLQLPFSLAAYALGRLLLTAARSLGRLCSPRLRKSMLSLAIRKPATRVTTPRLPALALGYGSRGPPATSR